MTVGPFVVESRGYCQSETACGTGHERHSSLQTLHCCLLLFDTRF